MLKKRPPANEDCGHDQPIAALLGAQIMDVSKTASGLRDDLAMEKLREAHQAPGSTPPCKHESGDEREG